MSFDGHNLEEMVFIPLKHIYIILKEAFRHDIQGDPSYLPCQPHLEKYIKIGTIRQILKNEHSTQNSHHCPTISMKLRRSQVQVHQ